MFKNIDYLKNEDMKKHTTFKIGGPAKFFLIPKNLKELKCCLDICDKKRIKTFILGNGSNLLVDDKGFDGAIISLKHFNKIQKKQLLNSSYVSVEAGTTLFELNSYLQKNGITGLEWSFGIPGSVGGAIRMNAGAFNNEIKDCLYEIKYLKHGKLHSLKKFNFSYRSGFKDGIIISAKFKLKTSNMLEVKENMNNFLSLRKATQPIDFPSAGSIFKRSENMTPAKIIDELGLKGLKIGDAMISTKHAGFIVNIKNAKSSDVLTLISIIKLIFKSKNTNLEEEIIYLN